MKMPMRNEVPVELTWDLTSIYQTEDLLFEDIDKVKALSLEMEKNYKGNLNQAVTINTCLDDLREVTRLLTLIMTYTELDSSVDYYNSHSQELYGKAMRVASEVESRLSFISGEIMEQSQEVLNAAAEIATDNKLYLLDILRQKPHHLQPETERVLAALNPTINAPYQIYNVSKLADMKFDSFTVNGKEYPLGYTLFEDDYQYTEDTDLRRAAFAAFSNKIREYENTTAAVYNSQVQTEKTLATLRGFDSVFDSLLFPQKVSREMYDRQIDLITEKLAPHMRKYAQLLKKTHKLDKITYADLKLPVDSEYDPRVTIEESKNYIVKGLSCLGEEYVSMIETAYKDRWVDFAQNQGKSTGGFCCSPYGKNSFILLSWNNRMSDVFTLAHEFGHAGHFKLCNAAQSIFNTDVSTYVVEAPSTMNELIMAHYMLKTSDDKRFRRWVLSSMIGKTYYHNFVTHLLEAAYQREVYKIVDAGGSVDASTLNELKKGVLTKFWGEDVEMNDGAELTWMRQPHYYMGLYPYTYSAGLTIATQVCKRIETEGQAAVEDWKCVLAAGSTVDPEGFAKMAGVDITTDQPLLDTIAYIGQIIDEIWELTEEM